MNSRNFLRYVCAFAIAIYTSTMNDSEPVNALKLQHKIPAHSKTQVPVQVPSGQTSTSEAAAAPASHATTLPDVEPPNAGQQAPIGGHGGDACCALLGLIGSILGLVALQQTDTEPVTPTEP